MRQIFLDTETTGKYPTQDRLVEIGCVAVDDRTASTKDSDRYHTYLNPEMEIDENDPNGAFRIHGLGNAFLSDKPKFADVAGEFIQFIRSADEVLIHNAEFDVGFINMELGRLGLGKLSDYCPKITDTLALARKKFPGAQNNLNVLVSRLEIDANRLIRRNKDIEDTSSNESGYHGALIDSEILAEVYLAMTREQGSLIGSTTEELTHHELPDLPDSSRLILSSVSAEEHAQHIKFNALIEKKCKGPSQWSKQCPTEPTA